MTRGRCVYLDHAASSPLSQAALEAEAAYEALPFAGANPNSLHTPGRQAARALDDARATLARCAGGRFRPSDVIFTSGGTESNNLAILGMAEGARIQNRRRSRVVLSAIEHDSVLDLVPTLRARGFEVTTVPARRDGRVAAEQVRDALAPDVALVSLMSANNETGIAQDVVGIAADVHAAGARLHTDAVQAFCRMPIDLAGVDAASIAAHKIGGPVGVGALLVRPRVPLRPASFGGGQEGGRRAGTQDVRGALAFAAAARACAARLDESRMAVARRSQALVDRVTSAGVGIRPTVDEPMDAGRLPGIVSLLVSGVDSETLVLSLDERGFAVSAGSACSSGSLDPSHVLLAMGISRDEAFGALRVSFDERVAEEDLRSFADALVSVVCERTGRRPRTDTE